MVEMDGLIEALVAGPGSRELSDRVLLACGWTAGRRGEDWRMPNGWAINSFYAAPSPSENLQDAVDLIASVPEANCHGYDAGPRSVTAYISRNAVKEGHWLNEADGPTPALALCIAILKSLPPPPQD